MVIDMEVKVESLGRIFVNKSQYRHGGVTVKKIGDGKYEVDLGYKMRTVSFRLDEETYQRLVEVAKRENTTVSYIIRRALSEYLSKQGV